MIWRRIRTKKRKLFFILTTNGGSIEEVERIVNVVRHFYDEVVFAIPDYAYSAGTVLCMSGDEIYMNYYSVLGPIDPQVPNKDGRYIPAQGYLDKVGEFIEKSRENNLTDAEFMMLRELDLANLRYYQQARELSIELLKKWLVRYKFKNWNNHRTTDPGRAVTPDEKEKRAEDIAADLSDNNRWKSHGRGLDIKTLQDLKLEIVDFEEDADLASNLNKYYALVRDYIGQRKLGAFFHTRRFI
ncbi:SDH family Clp fold serine proteinase [Synergistes jonesii]|uniref:SDH family Clp fold serine proteinase n=1 Tax=Synergistes jonesii TaxID=2754 RepID=UPI00114CDF80|nr:serine dehydrogenasease [Synergistes jonesii]